MKIINDPDLIQYRLVLQEEFYKATGDLALMALEFRGKYEKTSKLSREDLVLLRSKLQELAKMYYELEYGNYFIKKSNLFQEGIIQSLVKLYYDKITDESIEDVFKDSYMNIYGELEAALQNQIKIEKNGR